MQRLMITIKTLDEKYKFLQIKTKSSMFKKRLVKTWTVQEDQSLLSLHNQYPKKWNIISERMKNRNQNQCLHRFRRICKMGQSKKIWSTQQDKIVLKTMDTVGHNWKMIAHILVSKTGKQIRQRFINKLDPNIRREQWTEQQDMKIIELYTELGSKWCQISKCLPGRPENRIKNRFYSFIQKNYEFKVRQNMVSEQSSLQNKQNSVSTTRAKADQNKQSANSTLDIKPSSSLTGHRILQQKTQNHQEQKPQIPTKQQSNKDSINNLTIQEQKNCNSLKQINDQCFSKFNSNANINDLLYFQDN